MITMTWPQYCRHECRVSGEAIVRLPPFECELLSTMLVRHPGPLTLKELVEIVYPDPDAEPEWAQDLVRWGLRRLSSRVGAYHFEIEPRYIGYRLHQGGASEA